MGSEIVFPSGRKGNLLIEYGRVTNHQSWSETHVRSSPGYVNRETGAVSAPVVTSTVVERQQFWLEDTSGKQTKYELSINVANGHELALVWGFVGKTCNLLYWWNPTSQKHNLFDEISNKFLLTKEGKKRGRRWFYGLLVIALAIGWYVGGCLKQDPTDPMAQPATGAMLGFFVGLIVALIARASVRSRSANKKRSALLKMCSDFASDQVSQIKIRARAAA